MSAFNLNMLIFCAITTFAYLLDSIAEIQYSKILGRTSNRINLEIIINIADFILIFSWIFVDLEEVGGNEIFALSLILSFILGL